MSKEDFSGRDATEAPFAGYMLERRIAVGGMSEVFLARPREDSSTASLRARGVRHVVLKRLLPDLVEDDSVRDAFEQEAGLHRLAKHPNVVEFYEYGTYAGEPFIALEYVAGSDLSRLMRRARADERSLGVPLAIHIARELCAGLAYVHDLVDERGLPLGVVHRDVTPSNILLSRLGETKLGDFGIAHVEKSVVGRTSLALKGKYAYLAPEQVSGDHFDQRADLFSLAVVVSEMLIGQPLFPGAGQLAVLLAIRDARIDALRAAQGELPKGLFEVLATALERSPGERFASAGELRDALLPFASSDDEVRNELCSWVSYSADTASAARKLEGAVLETLALTKKHDAESARAGGTKPPDTGDETSAAELARATSPEDRIVCLLRRDGHDEPVHLAKLIEMLATGQVKPDDDVDFGDGFHRVERVAMLSRYLPPTTATTKRLSGPGVPDFVGSLPETSLADALLWIVRQQESGVLFAEPAQPSEPRSELYFKNGKLILAVSSSPSMLLGERLVSKGIIDRGELELAVLVMHRYNGQIGDTLIGLGLVDPVEVFQSIRAQGRERVAALFGWARGRLSFYRGVEPARLDFRLDLDVPGLVLGGLAETRSDEAVSGRYDALLEDELRAAAPPPSWAKQVTWPSLMMGVLRGFAGGARVGSVVASLTTAGDSPPRKRAPPISRADVYRAIEACQLLRLLDAGELP
jgi:eukaryotic-like serine/threonine-protein kinase